MEQGQEPSLPKGVAPIHQLVAAALESTLKAHLPPGHPVLWGDGNQCGTKDPWQDEAPSIPERGHSPAGSGGSAGVPA